MKDSIKLTVWLSRTNGVPTAEGQLEYRLITAERVINNQAELNIREANDFLQKRGGVFLMINRQRNNITCRETLRSRLHEASKLRNCVLMEETVKSHFLCELESPLVFQDGNLQDVVDSFSFPFDRVRVALRGKRLCLHGEFSESTPLDLPMSILMLRLLSVSKHLYNELPSGKDGRVLWFLKLVNEHREDIENISRNLYGADPSYFGMDGETLVEQLMYLYATKHQILKSPYSRDLSEMWLSSFYTRVGFDIEYGHINGLTPEEVSVLKKLYMED